MRQFFKFMLASMVGIMIAGVVLILIFIGMLSSTLSSSFSFNKSEKTTVHENSVLHIKLNDEIVERSENNELDFVLGELGGESQMGLNDILANLDKAKDDDRIEGIFLDLSVIPAWGATLKEIRDKIVDFKDGSDKWVVCYAEYMNQGTYYIASVADEVYLYPEGYMEMSGLSMERMYFKGLFEKLGIEMQVIRGSDNEYKSAVEPFTRTNMSDAAKEQTIAWVGDLWKVYIQEIAESRSLSIDKMNLICDSLLIREPEDAVKQGLADGTMYRDEMMVLIKDKLELEEDDKIEFASFSKYTNARVKKTRKKDSDDDDKKFEKRDKIAVVYAEGEIRSGENEEGIGSDVLAKAIRQAREDSTVKAIVLRVNSPGGSALASDVIWREAVLAQETKPFIVSMGNVAASGGYYISCAADKIFAQENTITGSIGVFGMVPNMKEFWNEKMGITFDGIKTNHYADLGTTSRAMSETEIAIVQDMIDNIYDDFTMRVAEGRDMSQEDVVEIAKGRVWSGIQAKENGLIDEFGGIDEAIDEAADMAGLDDFRLVSYPETKDKFMEILKGFGASVKEQVILDQLGDDVELYKKMKAIKEAADLKGVQARLPYVFTID